MGRSNRANLKSVEGEQPKPETLKPIPFGLSEQMMAQKAAELIKGHEDAINLILNDLSRYLEKAHGLPEGAIGPNGQYSISTDGLMPQTPGKME